MRRVLFVCTGNQCRSAAAAAILGKLSREAGVDVEVLSAGTHAWDGVPAQAVTAAAAADQGFDLSTHRSRPVSAELLRDVDVVLAMAREHAYWLDKNVPGIRERVHLFKPYCEGRADFRHGDDIPDPIGQPLAVHAACVRDIAGLLSTLVERWKRDRA